MNINDAARGSAPIERWGEVSDWDARRLKRETPARIEHWRGDGGPSRPPRRRVGLRCPCANRGEARSGVAPDAIAIEPGALADYAALSRFHYRAGRPATIVHILRAIDLFAGDACTGDAPEPIAVLVISMPILNGPWRDMEGAWPGRYCCKDRREAARRLNDEVRTISRVIVDPRWRALGIGSELVRAYLREPLTPRTEALAAMSACCPVFDRAGMRRIDFPPSRAEIRLRDSLRLAGLAPWELVARPWLAASPWLEEELRRWANASRGTRKLLAGPLRALAFAAAGAVVTPRCAFVHDTDSITRATDPALRVSGFAPDPPDPSDRPKDRTQR
jgi:GNAT superfamily N-acetyltransferase